MLSGTRIDHYFSTWSVENGNVGKTMRVGNSVKICSPRRAWIRAFCVSLSARARAFANKRGRVHDATRTQREAGEKGEREKKKSCRWSPRSETRARYEGERVRGKGKKGGERGWREQTPAPRSPGHNGGICLANCEK